MLRPPGAHEDQRGGGEAFTQQRFGTGLPGGKLMGVVDMGSVLEEAMPFVGHSWVGGVFLRTRTRVGIQHRNALLARGVLEETLLGAVVGGTGQAGQVNE